MAGQDEQQATQEAWPEAAFVELSQQPDAQQQAGIPPLPPHGYAHLAEQFAAAQSRLVGRLRALQHSYMQGLQSCQQVN